MNSVANETIQLLKAHEIVASKSMGQNFLVDPNIPPKIANASGVDMSCGVIEIGPGLGALTMELSNISAHVTAIELDKRLAQILENIFSDRDNVDIICGDALKIDITKIVSEKYGSLKRHVCANLPYNITTPLITNLVRLDLFDSLTIMVQKEVAERICADAGSSDYGAFSVFSNYYTEPEILFDVPPNCFFPRPKVMSSVIRMNIIKERKLDAESEKAFFKVVRAAFNQRRKTLVNALHSVYGSTYSKDEISGFVVDCGFDVRIRGEKLNIDEFIEISKLMN